jgi:hypothetical protein
MPAALYNTDARKHSMEEMKIIRENGKALHLSRVSYESRSPTCFRSLLNKKKLGVVLE